MATANPYLRFQKLFEGKPRLRAQIIAVDTSLNRVRVQYSTGNEWINGTGVVDDYVMIEGDQIVGKLPALPYDRVEVD